MPSTLGLLLLQVKCYVNWALVFLRIKKPLLVVLTGPPGTRRSAGISFTNGKLPGSLGLFQSFHRQYFYEITLDNTIPTKKTLFEISLPKSVLASQLSSSHLLVVDRLTVDALAFNHLARVLLWNREMLELIRPLEEASQLKSRYRVKIYFLRYGSETAYREALRKLAARDAPSDAEQKFRLLSLRDFKWFKQQEVCLVLRHFLRVLGYGPEIHYVERDSDDSDQFWISLFHDALSL